ncbi:hypothetical protein ACFL6S_21255 [Candidatus Poribacteria bacterium]
MTGMVIGFMVSDAVMTEEIDRSDNDHYTNELISDVMVAALASH